MADAVSDFDEFLADPVFKARVDETSAALEAAEFVRDMRRQTRSKDGKKGISQSELATRIGLTQARISQIENATGRDGVSYALMRKIALACGLDWGNALRKIIARDEISASAAAGKSLIKILAEGDEVIAIDSVPVDLSAVAVELTENGPRLSLSGRAIRMMEMKTGKAFGENAGLSFGVLKITGTALKVSAAADALPAAAPQRHEPDRPRLKPARLHTSDRTESED